MPTDDPASIQRRLAAIFCADVEGYTRLMRADEPATLRLLASCRDITDRLLATRPRALPQRKLQRLGRRVPGVVPLETALATAEVVGSGAVPCYKQRDCPFLSQ
jgi:class 3 adenylate cyclase